MAGEQSPGNVSNEYGNKLLNGEGLLHLVGTIKAEISNAGGSGGGGGEGATYTAGDGIEINENNVISRKGGTTPLFGLLRLLLCGGNAQNQRQSEASGAQTWLNDTSVLLNASNLQNHIANLNAYGMTYITSCMSDTIFNIVNAMGDDGNTSFKFQKGSYDTASRTVKVFSTTASKANNYNTVGSYVSNQPTLVIFDKTKPYGSFYRWWVITQPERILETIPFYSKQGLTSTNMSNAIDELAQKKQNTLTAGTGISITNGVISVNLANAESESF